MSTAQARGNHQDPDADITVIAKYTGLSTRSIRSCLNQRFPSGDDASVVPSAGEDDLLSTIRKTCQDLGFVPGSPFLRARIYPERADLVFFISDSVIHGKRNPYFGRMLQALLRSANEEEIRVSCSDFHHNDDFSPTHKELPQAIRDGLANKFVIAGRINHNLVDELMNTGGYLVFLSRASNIPGTVSIVPDYRGAAKQAIQMLFAHGHRSIAIAGAPYFQEKGYNYRELTAGAMEAAADLDIPLTGEDIYISKDWHVADRPDFIYSIRNSPKQYTAIFCLDDTIANALYKAVALVDLSIPDDFSLVGCNDQEDIDHLSPKLSTVHVPLNRMGRRVLEEAINLVRNGRPESARIIRMSTTPTLRGSIRFI